MRCLEFRSFGKRFVGGQQSLKWLFHHFYRGDLNSKQVWYSDDPKQFVGQMARYSSHVLNSELMVPYLNSKKFGNQMEFGYQTFYHGR